MYLRNEREYFITQSLIGSNLIVVSLPRFGVDPMGTAVGVLQTPETICESSTFLNCHNGNLLGESSVQLRKVEKKLNYFSIFFWPENRCVPCSGEALF